MKLEIRGPITTVKEIEEVMSTIERNLQTKDKDLINRIGKEIEDELNLDLMEHCKIPGNLERDYPGLSTEKIEQIIENISIMVYRKACEFYDSAKLYFKNEEYNKTISCLGNAIKHHAFFWNTMEKEKFNEVRREISQWYLLRSLSNWNAQKYQDACSDVGMAIINNYTDNKKDLKKIEGEMWHALIRSHEGKSQENPHYKAYWNSSAWRRDKRDARKKVDGDLCICGQRILKSEVHHKTYARVGKEDLSDLVRLCKECHELCHNYYHYTDTWPSFVDNPFELVSMFSYDDFNQIIENSNCS